MNIVGIENITPYENVYEFDVYEYNDDINLNDKNLFVCNLKIILTKVQMQYRDRLNKSVQALALVSNLSKNKKNLDEDIKELIFQEIYDEDLEKENIDIMFIQG
jgi:hypothetical protein